MIKKKYLIFDVDGVLIDSKLNMYLSWKKVQKIHNLEMISFDEYFKHIGRPFKNILKLIGIKKDFSKIKKTYQRESSEKKNEIRFYNDTISVLNNLKKKNYILSIVTSKDLKRTKNFLGKNFKLFKYIQCDDGKVRGKPFPDQVDIVINKLKARRSECIYIGDTNVDHVTAKNSNIDFIFALWGYGKKYNYKTKCKSIKELPRVLKKFENISK